MHQRTYLHFAKDARPNFITSSDKNKLFEMEKCGNDETFKFNFLHQILKNQDEKKLD